MPSGGHPGAVHPFLRPDSVEPADLATDAAIALLADHGLPGLSVRAIAKKIGVTGPALTQRWAGAQGARSALVTAIARTFAERWHLWARGPLIGCEPTLGLPSTDAESGGVRAWLALEELGRAEARLGNLAVGYATADARRAEREQVVAMVRTTSGEPIRESTAFQVCALAATLRSELVEPAPAIGLTDARRVLRDLVAVAQTRG